MRCAAVAKLNWEKADRTQKWRESQHDCWSGVLPPVEIRATEKQIKYIQSLLVKNGRRDLTDKELGQLTISGASRLIEQLVNG